MEAFSWSLSLHRVVALQSFSSGSGWHLSGTSFSYQISGFRPSWLLTSLMDPEQCRYDEWVDLYHRRWSIETLYREWKHGWDIQNLRSHTPAGLIKEVYAHLMLSNLDRWVMTQAAEGTSETPVDFSFLTTLTHVKNALWHMLRARPDAIVVIYQQLLGEVRAAKIRKRPGRSYPRKNDNKPKNRGHGKYPLPSRLPPPLT